MENVKIVFSEPYFKPSDIISGISDDMIISKFWHFLGFKKYVKLKVLSEKKVGINYEYETNYVTAKLTWFKWKIYERRK